MKPAYYIIIIILVSLFVSCINNTTKPEDPGEDGIPEFPILVEKTDIDIFGYGYINGMNARGLNIKSM